MLLGTDFFHGTVIKIKWGKVFFWSLRVNMTSWACFEGSRLKLIFHWIWIFGELCFLVISVLRFAFLLYYRRICGIFSNTFSYALSWIRFFNSKFYSVNPLSDNPTKWWNTFKHFVGKSRPIVWEFLTILWGWCLKG